VFHILFVQWQQRGMVRFILRACICLFCGRRTKLKKKAVDCI
jgi:hypothetical protein